MKSSNYINKKSTDRSKLLTEEINTNSIGLDQMNTRELVNLFSLEDLEPQKAVKKSLNDIIEAIDNIVYRLEKGGKLFYIGAGTSGRLGVLDASECPPTFCTSPDLVQGIIAGGEKSLTSSSEELEDSNLLAIKDLKSRNFSEKDILIGISAGGTTNYVKSGLEYSLSIKALAISISCVPKSQIKIPADIDIRLLTGPEILAGSTRLKAGTATKMALNMISTSVMIKLGKVYGNLMVDLSTSNQKLLDRGIRIITLLTNVNRELAISTLFNSGGSVKLALVMLLKKVNKEEAELLLKTNNNQLHRILDKTTFCTF
tara:strand:+ start:15544 stop:16488 length:945 start_codon:yes stop_codon:yes gene_type:complete